MVLFKCSHNWASRILLPYQIQAVMLGIIRFKEIDIRYDYIQLIYKIISPLGHLSSMAIRVCSHDLP